ncbi:MAG TPA: hypothetical protein VK488_12975 [Gaiellaceae bacterium]|nr:hypothetical protein [Gaiellaceae bacterium]
MRALLIGIIYGAAGIGAYEGAQAFGVRVAAFALAGTVLAALVLTVVAFRVAEKQPLLTALLIESMPTVLCLAIAAAAGAGLIRGSISLIRVTGEHPSAPVHALSDAIGALLVLAVSFLAKFGELSSPRTFGRRFVCRRYTTAFPAMPISPGPQLDAYRAVRAACQGEGSWGLRDLKRCLTVIQKAR